MEWVLVAAVVVALLVAISITGRQRQTVRAQQAQLQRLEAKLDAALGQQPPPPMMPNGALPEPRYGVDPRLDEVQRLVREGKKIQAIKRYREVTGVGLAEAKAAVERISG